MVELEVIPACRELGLGLLPWSPLAGGILGGALAKAAEGRRSSENATRMIEKLRPKLEAYEGFCREIGHQPGDIALAWLLQNPVVTAPIIGPRTIEQLEGALGVFEIELTEEQLAKLDEIFPDPGGEAPEAYAW
jgi:aryl-alcohol dehydrogenase-like predicted oxidoreductase